MKKYFILIILILFIGLGVAFADTTTELDENTDPQLDDVLYWIDVSAPANHRAHKILWGTLLDDTRTDNTHAWSASKIISYISALPVGQDEVTLSTDADAILELINQQIGLDDQSANKVFAGPTTGAADAPTFRSLVSDDIPDISDTYQPRDVDLDTWATVTPSANVQTMLGSANNAAILSNIGALGTTGDGSGLTGITQSQISVTAGDAYSNFSESSDDDTIDELMAGIDTAFGLRALDSSVVHLSGDEEIVGIKTFTSFPITPSSAPTTDFQAANKKYVDDIGVDNSRGFRIESPGEGTYGDIISFAQNHTITKVWCKTDTGTVTLNLVDGSSNDVLTSELVCDSDVQSTCADGCDVDTINASYDDITAVTEFWSVGISATADYPTYVTIYVGW
jgi:hypothetical protein